MKREGGERGKREKKREREGGKGGREKGEIKKGRIAEKKEKKR